MKQTTIVVIVLVAFAIALALALGLGLGLRNHKPRDDSNIKAPPGGQLGEGGGLPEHPGRGGGRGRGGGGGPGEGGKGGMVTDDMKTTPMPTTPKPMPKSEYGKYRNMTVQSDLAECSKIGADILVTMQGSATDAAVATILCVGTMNMQSIGLGGGHFMVHYDAKTSRMTTRLSREVCPKAGHQDMFKNVSSYHGGMAIGVPGELKGLYTAWQLHGKVPWRQLVAPAIEIAQFGFPIHGALAGAIKVEEEGIRKDPNLKKMFVKSDDSLMTKGDILMRPKYAESLRRVAEDPDGFYKGSLADDIVADIQERGGIITKEDLLDYVTQDATPIMGRLKNLKLTMYSPPPPSSGVIAQLIMRLLDGYNMTSMNIKDNEASIQTYQRLLEVWKHSFAKRSSLGDAAFVNVRPILDNLTSDIFIEAIKGKISEEKTRATDHYEPQFEHLMDSGTSQVNVLAADGCAVAMTATINTYFGSHVLGTRTGIMFNNEMDDFSVPGKTNAWGFDPSPSNYAEPGKMPMSSMSPTIYLTDDNKVAFMVGGEGGPTIISSTTFVALHNLYLGLSLNDAVDHPRIHNQLLPEDVMYEKGWESAIIDGLIAKGHKFIGPKKAKSTVGSLRNYCATCKKDCSKNCIEAVSDWRKEGGSPYGY